MSTPAASESRIRESTVFELGSRMSTRRLCVRISNCSRLSLSMNGDRRTVNFSIRVGSGTGPTTSAPVRCAVSTIGAAGQGDGAGDVRGPKVELRPIAVVERRMAATLLLRQDVDLGGELRVRLD